MWFRIVDVVCVPRLALLAVAGVGGGEEEAAGVVGRPGVRTAGGVPGGRARGILPFAGCWPWQLVASSAGKLERRRRSWLTSLGDKVNGGAWSSSTVAL